MSADIEKLAVFDSRIIQSRPKYAVEKGALSLTNAPFNAIAASSSQHTYNIYVPSENVYVDRAVEWSSTCATTFTLSLNTAVPGQSVVVAGRDFSLCAFPLNSLCQTLTATINDTTAVINSQDVLKEVLRLTDYKKNRLQRTCPTMLDRYMFYSDGTGAVNNATNGYESATTMDETPNGAFYNLIFTDATGAPLPASGPAPGGLPYSCVNGQPVCNASTPVSSAPSWSAGTTYTPGQSVSYQGNYCVAVAPVLGTAPASPAWTVVPIQIPIYIQWRSTEKLVLSPFVFSDVHEWDTGLFGINNIQLIMNLNQPALARIIRNNTGFGRVIPSSSVQFFNPTQFGGTPFNQSVVNVMFLTPSLDVPLPPKSVVGYTEFPRYITQYQNGTIAPGATGQIVSQTITLPQIPDLFIIYAKSPSYSCQEGDWRFPVATRADGINNPLSVNFDNFSGLLSSVTAEQLYAMSVKNGLDMDWNTWVGYAHSASSGPQDVPPSNAVGFGRIPLAGGILVLKPSQDITLQTGQAPSLVGNFTFQFNLTVKNCSPVPQTPQLFVITANSGFFESIRGSSRIIKGVLSEQDIISAPLAPMGTRDQLDRVVGGAGVMSKLANVLSRAKEVYHHTKPEAKEGGMSAGALGAGRSRAPKGLSARLM